MWFRIFTSNPNCRVPIANGGTGATRASAALASLGAAKSEDVGYVSNLETNEKTIVGAITEVRSEIETLATETNGSIEVLNKLDVIDLIYPVGAIYMSVNNANPSTLFGGTWVSWSAGKVPIGVDADDTDFSTVEKTGGEKTHTLTLAEMPSHAHSVGYAQTGIHVGEGGSSWNDRANLIITTANTGSTGGDGAHNNLQPYITCYMWKRTG